MFSTVRSLLINSAKLIQTTPLLTDISIPFISVRTVSTFNSKSSSQFAVVDKESNAKLTPIFSYDRRFLKVKWKAGDNETYPLVWLRNNCRCPKCFDSSALARKILGRHLILEPQIADYVIDSCTNNVTITWDDGHESTYTADWLIEHGFNETRRAERRRETHQYDLRFAWDRNFKPQVFDFDHTVGTDEGMLDFLRALKVYGLCILNGAKGVEEPLERMTEKFGYTVPTAYGHYFSVTNKGDPSNLAYTTATLGLHVDLAMYRQTPGIQCLHCVAQTSDIEGGDNYFADAMFAGRRIRKENRQAFDLLVNEEIFLWDYGSDYIDSFHMRNIRPTFRVNSDEDVIEIAYNHQVRDSLMVMEPEKVPDWFRAIDKLETVMMEEAVYRKLKSGQIACFDNTRVLHGRNGYRMTESNSERHLRGAYYGWDEADSMYRRLQERFGHSK